MVKGKRYFRCLNLRVVGWNGGWSGGTTGNPRTDSEKGHTENIIKDRRNHRTSIRKTTGRESRNYRGGSLEQEVETGTLMVNELRKR